MRLRELGGTLNTAEATVFISIFIATNLMGHVEHDRVGGERSRIVSSQMCFLGSSFQYEG